MANNQKSMLAAIAALVGQLNAGPVREELEAALRGGPRHKAKPDEIRQEIVSGREAAVILNCTKRSVGNFAREGLIVPLRLPGRHRAVGYTRQSVERLAAGGVA